MQVLVTGATGYIGSSVQRALLVAGHDVTAIVRRPEAVEQVRAAGATALEGDVTDVPWMTDQLAAHDGAIHMASPNDATSADFDRAVATTAVSAFAGTGKPYIHTGGIWVFGNNDSIDEDAPLMPPALTAWRPAVEQLVFDGSGMRGIVVAPGIVYGNGGGLPNLLVGAPRDGEGNLVMVGDGFQHWTTVHVDDLADLYVRALEQAPHGSSFIGVNGDTPTVRDLGEAAARAAGAPGVTGESVEASRARLGEAFADALLLDQQATGRTAREVLGWSPSEASLVDEIEHGSYAHAQAANA